jgi:hypothetical protein
LVFEDRVLRRRKVLATDKLTNIRRNGAHAQEEGSLTPAGGKATGMRTDSYGQAARVADRIKRPLLASKLPATELVVAPPLRRPLPSKQDSTRAEIPSEIDHEPSIPNQPIERKDPLRYPTPTIKARLAELHPSPQNALKHLLEDLKPCPRVYTVIKQLLGREKSVE